MLESLPMVSEVNAISEELNKHKYVQKNVDFTSTDLCGLVFDSLLF